MRDPADVVDALDELWRAMLALLGDIDASDWERPTPCAEWKVRELTAHLASGQAIFEGFPQPDPPDGWANPHPADTIASFTARSVAARSTWAASEIVDELERSTRAQLERFRALDDEGWQAPSDGPPGIKTVFDLARNRLLDGYVHLLDLRVALERPLDLGAEPRSFGASFAQVVDFTPWGAVKRAELGGEVRVGVELTGPEPFHGDLVVEGGRGRWVEPSDGTDDRVVGTTAAYLLVAAGRPQWAEDAGGIGATGPAARQLLDRYVIWAA